MIMEGDVNRVPQVPGRGPLVWPAALSSFGLTMGLGSLLLLSRENLHHKAFALRKRDG